jgi:OmpA-OmpF porin, OOP family
VDWAISIAVLAILGLIVGALAKFLMPGDDPGGIVATSILGIVGAIVGGMIANALGIAGITGFDWRSLVIAVAGSLLLLLAYRAFRMLMPRAASATYASRRSMSAGPLRAFGEANEHETVGAPNLADIARQSMTNEVVNRLSEIVGETPGSVWKALEAMIPTVLASMTSQASTPVGASRVFDLVEGAVHGGVDRHLGEGNLEAMGQQSAGLLSTLFGDKLAGLLNWLARFAGIKESSAASLLNVASSLVMNTVGRTIQQKRLDASQLAGVLSSQTRSLSRQLPSGIGDLPGMRALVDLGDRAEEVTRATTAAGRRVGATAERAFRETVREGSPLLSALVPLALLLLAIPLLGWFIRGAAKNVQPDTARTVRPESVEPLVTEAPAVRLSEANRPEAPASPKLTPTTFNVSDLRLPDGVTLQLPDSSFLTAIYRYLSDTNSTSGRAFVFDGLDFDDTKIRVRPEVETAVTNLTKLIRAFPSVTLRIEGHTDPSGDPVADQKRSLARADALKDMLVKAGVPGSRLTTAGIGSEHPVSTNDTADGRAKNRRIGLSLSKSS